MATLDYIDIPAAATRLRAASTSEPQTNAIRPAPKITTSLPIPSPPQSPSALRRRASSISLDSLTSPTLAFLPQLLLSSSLPSNPMGSPGPSTPKPTPKKKGEPTKPTVLSSKDPLSLPMTTNNFKRFVAKVGPVFWLQDRIEEIFLWKRGWKVTTVWMIVYALLCYFPRLILLIPHMSLLAIILATYPYPSAAGSDPLYKTTGSEPTEREAPPPPTDSSIPWQANIQAIQNLMGAVADIHTLLDPYVYHLSLSPAHFSSTRTQASISTHPSPSSHSPYTPHILTFLIVTFPPLLFLITLPAFPIRGVCLFVGLAPFAVTHPYGRALLPFIGPALRDLIPVVVKNVNLMKARVMAVVKRRKQPVPAVDDVKGLPLPLSMMVQRLVDDDRLSDTVWNSELREVELWENERFGGSPSPLDAPGLAASTSGPSPPQRGWSKLNLKPGERMAWTRGRDGWSGVEGNGEVSSNLTFSLSDGWAFVDTEDWRKDLTGEWSGCGADGDGWVYSNDMWLGPRPSPYGAGGGSVTRRRRWVRRVWFDASKSV